MIRRGRLVGLLLLGAVFGVFDRGMPAVKAAEKPSGLAVGDKVPDGSPLRDRRGNRRPLHSFSTALFQRVNFVTRGRTIFMAYPAADLVVWCSDQGPGFRPTRLPDMAFVGNIVQALAAYGSGALGRAAIPLNAVDRLIAIGSDGMMRAVAMARHGVLAPYLKPTHKGIGSINSPMQCMMKEICAQCLQMHKDPATGKETVVFSCFNQDQPLDHVEFGSLRSRLSQNGTQEKLTKLWVDHCLRSIGARPELVNQ